MQKKLDFPFVSTNLRDSSGAAVAAPWLAGASRWLAAADPAAGRRLAAAREG